MKEGDFYVVKTFDGKYAIIAVTQTTGNASDPISTVDLDIKAEQ